MILSSAALIKEYTDKGWWGTDTILDLFLKDVQNTPQASAVVDTPNRATSTSGDANR